MIKITRFFYIHWLVFPLLLIAWFGGGFYTMLTAYAVVSVHELFHLFAALLVRERVGSIIVMPFGMTLRLSARIIRHTGKEIFIALSGPFANCLMLIIAKIISTFYPSPPVSLSLFYLLNLSVMALNLLPCLPLDGGRVLRAVLTKAYGFLFAASFLRKISRIITAILMTFGVLLLMISRLNISLLMVASFLALYMTEEKKRNDYILMQEMLYVKEKLRKRGQMRCRTVSALFSLPAKDVFKAFSYDCYCIIHVLDEEQRYLRTITEAELVDSIVKKGWKICLRDV